MFGHRKMKLSIEGRSFLMGMNIPDFEKSRPLSFAPLNIGFLGGSLKGLSATNDVYDVPKLSTQMRGHAGLELDVKALRSDVRKAKAKLTRQAANAAG